MSRRKRIGIMGGTFNPVHMVHLILAENAYRTWQLDEIMMLPNGDPPHKTDIKITPAADRLAMLKLAVKDIPYFRISEMEIKRQGYSYSSVTLEELKKSHPDTDYYFIMGADSVFQIETWHDPATVMADCIILAATRDHTPAEKLNAQIDYLKAKYKADIRLLDIPDLELSSSEIRKRISRHQPVRFMIPDAVLEYIEEHQLYLH
ncbi:MAG: nicotinate-nucleotide adenylyltransferase [Coprococcus sp.]